MSWAFDRAHGHLPDINRFELPRDSSHPHRPAISSDTDPRGIIVARRVHTDQVRGVAAGLGAHARVGCAAAAAGALE